MADWKQITARIRRARGSKDPAAQLSNLYQKTRDAMVAYELGQHFETAGQSGEAAKWYSTAAERFRRADWKTKAREAAARLSGQSTETPNAVGVAGDNSPAFPTVPAPLPSVPVPEPTSPFEQSAAAFTTLASSPEQPAAVQKPLHAQTARRRRRGRRGGRTRQTSSSQQPTRTSTESATFVRDVTATPQVDEFPESRFSKVSESISPASEQVELVRDSATAPARGRYGDPGVSSRLTLLEMQFRRLLSCPPLKLNEGDRAPAGPGVLLLSDSDLSTHYYVEACQTLRIAVTSLLRAAATKRGSNSIKPKLAEHLGIAESRVSKYLADHCVVRYLQLDDDASHFAHFVIAVLRPALND